MREVERDVPADPAGKKVKSSEARPPNFGLSTAYLYCKIVATVAASRTTVEGQAKSQDLATLTKNYLAEMRCEVEDGSNQG